VAEQAEDADPGRVGECLEHFGNLCSRLEIKQALANLFVKILSVLLQVEICFGHNHQYINICLYDNCLPGKTLSPGRH